MCGNYHHPLRTLLFQSPKYRPSTLEKTAAILITTEASEFFISTIQNVLGQKLLFKCRKNGKFPDTYFNERLSVTLVNSQCII